MAYQTRVVLSFGIATRCTVFWCAKCNVAMPCHHEWLSMGHSMHIWEREELQHWYKSSQKVAKWTRWDAVRKTSVAADGKDAFHHMRPYHKPCEWTGYKKSPIIWKAKKCTSWNDEPKITMIRPLVAGQWLCEAAWSFLIGAPLLVSGMRISSGNSRSIRTSEWVLVQAKALHRYFMVR